MRFHQLLIAAGIIFFLGYALLELRHYTQSGGVTILVRSIVSLAATIALGLYLKAFRKSLRP